MLNWLEVDWEEILNDEDAVKGITNWKRRYTHQHKRQQLHARFGLWVNQHLQPPKLENDGWREGWAERITDDNIYWDATASKNDKAPRM